MRAVAGGMPTLSSQRISIGSRRAFTYLLYRITFTMDRPPVLMRGSGKAREEVRSRLRSEQEEKRNSIVMLPTDSNASLLFAY